MSTGPYRVPNLDYIVEGVYTNTMANGAYRGAGRRKRPSISNG